MTEELTRVPVREIFDRKEIERLKFQQWRVEHGMQPHETDQESRDFIKTVNRREKLRQLGRK